MTYTLIGKDLAKKGVQFIAQDSEECKTCRLYPICIKNLTLGRRYVIKDIKDKVFQCKLSGEVILVDVELAEIPILVEKKKAIEGVTLEFKPLEKKKRELFNPEGLNSGDKVRIIKILEDYDKNRKKVLVRII